MFSPREFRRATAAGALAAALAAGAGLSAAGTLVDEVRAADLAADAAVASAETRAQLAARQSAWRTAWLKGLGGLPEKKTPLDARTGQTVACEGFSFQNVCFQSQPGVYVTGHLALPDGTKFAPPYPCVLMPLGHSDTGILNPRYATLFAMVARAGMAAFAWDPISQGERRQSETKYDYTDNCSTEHARLGARGWLVGWNFARFRIWDAIRAVDYVCSRPEIDAMRLGVTGTSGGGTMSAYLQALDDRISVAFPNCFVSSVRAVFGERGCHDAEQFYFGQLRDGVNHAAMLAMGQPRVAFATGSRWRDYFPHAGAVDTFAVLTNLTSRLGFVRPCWHFSCDGPHGLPPSTRAAQLDWMRRHLLGADELRSPVEYRALDPSPTADPANAAPLPFRAADAFFTPTHQVRDLPGFRSVYALIAGRARRLQGARRPKGREALREIVRRRASIRPLDRLLREGGEPIPFGVSFDWWYLSGAYGAKAENRAAVLATLGRSFVGEQAEAMIVRAAAEVAANGNRPVVLRARGWDCIAAAHAFAAEPQLFSRTDFADPPPSWTALVTNPDPMRDSMSIAVWGALEEYDWTDLQPPVPDDAALSEADDPRMRVFKAALR